ncbi:MAG: hypothetical protein ACRCX2_23155 [Paraclostridium sp.]
MGDRDICKQASMINKVFLGMEAVDGAKKVNSTYKDSNANKYDSILNTSIKKPDHTMGQANAVVSNNNFKSASDFIDELEKTARFTGKDVKKVIRDMDMKNTQNIKDAVSHAKNKKIGDSLKSAGKAVLPTAGAVGLAGGAGVATSKGLEKLDSSKDRDKDTITPKLIGGALTGALILNGVKNKSMLHPVSKSIEIAKEEVMKQPFRIVERTGPVGKFATNTLKSVGKKGREIGKSANKERESIARNILKREHGNMNPSKEDISSFLKKTKDFDKKYNNPTNKTKGSFKGKGSSNNQVAKPQTKEQKPSSVIDTLSDLRKKVHNYADEPVKKKVTNGISKEASNKEFAKKVFKDHFLKSGLESIPYYAAPAALGYALSTDLSKGFKKPGSDKKKDGKEKTAGFLNPGKKAKLEHATERAIERAADGLGRTVFPATVTAATGRNIMKSFDKVNHNDDTDTRDDIAKVIINIGDKDKLSKRGMKKEVSKAIDDFYKSATIIDESLDVGDIREEIEKKILENKKIKSGKVHIGEGIKKQFRMSE